MYKLEFLDGSYIDNVKRINPSTFEVEGTNSLEIYFQLNDDNLSCVTLYKDGNIEDIFMDYTRQNFSCINGIIRFRLERRKDL